MVLEGLNGEEKLKKKMAWLEKLYGILQGKSLNVELDDSAKYAITSQEKHYHEDRCFLSKKSLYR